MNEPSAGASPSRSPVDPVLASRLTQAGDQETLTVVVTVHRTPGEPVDPESTRAQILEAVAAASRASKTRPTRVQVMAYLARAVIHARPAFLRALVHQPQVTAVALTDPAG